MNQVKHDTRDLLKCPSGYVLTGLCGGGHDKDCKYTESGKSHSANSRIQCSQLPPDSTIWGKFVSQSTDWVQVLPVLDQILIATCQKMLKCQILLMIIKVELYVPKALNHCVQKFMSKVFLDLNINLLIG